MDSTKGLHTFFLHKYIGILTVVTSHILKRFIQIRRGRTEKTFGIIYETKPVKRILLLYLSHSKRGFNQGN